MHTNDESRGREPRSRLRDAYARARFPDVIVTSADLGDSGVVIDGARRCFGSGQLERALELLQIAIDEHPECEALWLARLELLGFAGAGTRFLEAVREFLDQHPDSEHFDEVVHFWRHLARSRGPGGAPAAASRRHNR